MLKTTNNFFSHNTLQTPTNLSKRTKLQFRKSFNAQQKHNFVSFAQKKFSSQKQQDKKSQTLLQKRTNSSQLLLQNRKNSSYALKKKNFSQLQFQKQNRKTVGSRILHTHTRKESKSLFNNSTRYHTQQQNRQMNIKQDLFRQEIDKQLLQKIYEIEQQYMQAYINQQYQQAATMLIKIINYTIDYNLVKHFVRAIKQIGQFYALIDKGNNALFYYDQARLAAILFNQNQILIDSIIQSSICCRKEQLFDQSIKFLKKGLQYCWFYNKTQQQLKIYDEIGKVYYLMGNLQKATNFHQKYVNAKTQPQNSPQRMLSYQRVQKYKRQQQIKTYIKFQPIVLASLNLPILSFKQLPQLSTYKLKLRNQYTISLRYFSYIKNIRQLVLKILDSQFYKVEIQQPDTKINSNRNMTINIDNSKMGSSNSGSSLGIRHLLIRKKKFDINDFKMKQHLKQMGIGIIGKIQLKPDNLQYKQPLQQKVKKKLKQPKLQRNWQSKLVNQIKRDRQNKLFKIHNQIRVRGKNLKIRPEIDHIRKIFMPFYL